MSKKKIDSDALVEQLFHQGYREGVQRIPFYTKDLGALSQPLGGASIEEIESILEGFENKSNRLPASIRRTQPAGAKWFVCKITEETFEFRLLPIIDTTPRSGLGTTDILDATPNIVTDNIVSTRHLLSVTIRYNRLVDSFLGIDTHLFKSYSGTSTEDTSDPKIDDLYLGTDEAGKDYAVPVLVETANQKIHRQQIDSSFALCRKILPNLACVAVVARFFGNSNIALLKFKQQDGTAVISEERHYRLMSVGQPVKFKSMKSLVQII